MDKRLIRILGGTTQHYPYALESKFPRILDHIMSLWDSDEIDECFMELMVSNRSGRQGFPPDVAAEIMHLSLVHAAQDSPDKHNDIWDVSPKSFSEFTPPTMAENGWKDPGAYIREELRKCDIACSPDGFFDAVEQGNRTAVALFLGVPVSTEIRDSRGWTPLMMAAFHGYDEITEMLIQHNADVNALDSSGNSPLHWAAFGGHSACTDKLIQHHAHADVCNNFGWTPLIQATARNHIGVVAQLIACGVNLDSSADGNSALHKAAAAGYTDILALLLEQGANKNLTNQDHLTALQLAIKNKQNEAARILRG
ncbi:MAG: ankyrin repeat domain-containing protein [Gallionella sp.]|nr:ankyrin repeat domain-containing protein [Gallionella sp.]MDD4946595.1 ankyrin repeat domain-containing protein [Gallionella sp.]MDD5612113.1 ankyrin repeat domain-containing protein [Gallionella sp.]